MKRTFLILIILCAAFQLPAQKALLWQKSYGGSGHEYIHQVYPLAGGGFVFTGYSESAGGDLPGNNGGEDLWVARANASGGIIWSYNYGGSEDDQGWEIIQTPDGGFIVVGNTESVDGDVSGHHGSYGTDVWVLRLNAAGQLIRQKCFGGSEDDDAEAVCMVNGNSFLIGASTYSYDGDVSGNHGTYESDIWVVSTDTLLQLLGQRCVGGTDYEECMDIVFYPTGGCVVTGRTYSADGDVTGYHSGSDMLIAKLNGTLNVDWAHAFGGSQTEEGNSLVVNSDGTIMALGYTSTHNNGDVTGHHGAQGSDDFWLVKTNSAGFLQWAECFGGSGDDQANGLCPAAGGGYVMCGLTNSTDGDVSGFHSAMFNPDFWVAGCSESGSFLWQRCCGGTGQDESFRISEESPGNFVVSGFTYSSDYDVTVNYGDADGWIIRLNGMAELGNIPVDGGIAVGPNPVNSKLTVSIATSGRAEIADFTGKVCRQMVFNGNFTLDVSELPAGMYFMKLFTDKGISGYKIQIAR